MSAALISRTIRKSFLQQINLNSSIFGAHTIQNPVSIFKHLSSTVPPGGVVQFDRAAIEKLTKNNKIVVFMKGNPEAPRCGFSNAVVQIMRMHGVKYDSHDVLENDEIRQGIKEFTNWPTIPQIFIDGEFVGGCDIMLQMHQNGELVEELKKCGINSALLETKNDEHQKDTNK